MGSGMGALIEALWGYYANGRLEKSYLEIGRLEENQYNDFACLQAKARWDPETRKGELFRIEAKSMNILADESKGHFDELKRNIGKSDQLLVIVWTWERTGSMYVYPRVLDQFFGSALGVAELRDALHLARGGTFVNKNRCPDGCRPEACTHDGEPLNESGKRERKSGPEACRVSSTTSFASNFGGLVRMLKTESQKARKEFRKLRRKNLVAHNYISFIHRNYPQEEMSQYLADEWRKAAGHAKVSPTVFEHSKKEKLAELVRKRDSDYQEFLRQL